MRKTDFLSRFEALNQEKRNIRNLHRSIMESQGRIAKDILDEVVQYGCVMLDILQIRLCEQARAAGLNTGEHFTNAWNDLVTRVVDIEESPKSVAQIYGDIEDLISLLVPNPSNVLAYFGITRKIGEHSTMCSGMILCALNMVEYCEMTHREAEKQQIVSVLVNLSRKRNAGAHGIHRNILVKSLKWIESNPNLTLQLCQENHSYFDELHGVKGAGYDRSEQAAWYEWWYAVAYMHVFEMKLACEHFRDCRTLRTEREGDFDWLAARAWIYENMLQAFEDTTGRYETSLWDALRKMDEEYYYPMPEDDRLFFTGMVLHTILHIRKNSHRMQGMLPYLERFLSICEQYQSAFMKPVLTVRNARHLMSIYYLQECNYLQAAGHALCAVNVSVPEEMEAFPPEVDLLCVLQVAYSSINDRDKLEALLSLVTERLDQAAEGSIEQSVLTNLLLATWLQQRVPVDAEVIESALSDLSDFAEEMDQIPDQVLSDESTDEVLRDGILLLNMTLILIFNDPEEHVLALCECVLQHFLTRPNRYRFDIGTKLNILNGLCAVKNLLKSPGLTDATEKLLELADQLPMGDLDRITMYGNACIRLFGKDDEFAVAAAEHGLENITEAWHRSVSCLNDRRLCKIVEILQLKYLYFLEVLRQSYDAEHLYMVVLQFKALASLAGRERNRILRAIPADMSLRDRIFSLQDQIAEAAARDMFNGTDSVQELNQELLWAEAQFAEKFPQLGAYTNISLKAVLAHLPVQTAILEYQFLPSVHMMQELPDTEESTENVNLEIFIASRTHGVRCLHFAAGDEIIDLARQLWEDMQVSNSAAGSAQNEMLCEKLYGHLITPMLPFLEDIRTLYIAPDKDLCNLSFGILMDADGTLLSERYDLMTVTCGRDILFPDTAPAGNPFLLGSPDYDGEWGHAEPAPERGFQGKLAAVGALPFSGVEVRRIGRILDSKVCLNAAATKYALGKELPARVIHLATHGYFTADSETLYTSCLLFAGANRWLRDHIASSGCGDGILTADEISRMDLHSTELVVLSACQSGLENTDMLNTQGLVSAFAAAGVKWVITHMWEADDFATAILMDAFYRFWWTGGMAVPNALREAQNYLRKVTVAQIREAGWLDPGLDAMLDEQGRSSLNRIRQCRIDRRRFFEDVFYWGGIQCHLCR